MRNSWVSLISWASCGSLAASVSIARRRSNGGRRNSFVMALLPIEKRHKRLSALLDAGAHKICSSQIGGKHPARKLAAATADLNLVLGFIVYADRDYWTTTGWKDDAVPDIDEGARGGEGRGVGDARRRGKSV